MERAEIAMIMGSLMAVAALAAWHLAGLLLLRRLKPSGGNRRILAVLMTFWGLLLLHFSEILFGALVLKASLAIPGAGTIEGGYNDTFSGLLYLAGITFTTLGYTDQSAGGPIRLAIMVQSLGGFMLLTWSATFVYSIWNERFR